jgi:cyclopropane-fatty-acyl-phospholipid synthase
MLYSEVGSDCDQRTASYRRALAQFFKPHGPRNFTVRFWDGSELPAENDSSQFTLVIKDPKFFNALLAAPSSQTLGEAYVRDVFDIEGDIVAAIALGDVFIREDSNSSGVLASAKRLLQRSVASAWTHRHAFHSKDSRLGRNRTREAISFHYDQPVEFWRLWLDPRLIYSCAYFPAPETSIADAQTAKLEMICRKLGLREGEKLLDIGCGWGGLVSYATKHYGVKATGITLSQTQADYARALIARKKLESSCRIETWDFREMSEPERYDKMTSIGMIEHVPGEAQLDYFQRAWRLLRPGGRFLNQGITASAMEEIRPGDSFIDAYVFPDARLVTISQTLAAAEAAGFEIRDVESLREHYARTSRLWRKALEAQVSEVQAATSETTFRIFRLYLAGFTSEFDRARLSLHQTLLVKPAAGDSRMPLTRQGWYRSGPVEENLN